MWVMCSATSTIVLTTYYSSYRGIGILCDAISVVSKTAAMNKRKVIFKHKIHIVTDLSANRTLLGLSFTRKRRVILHIVH